jgi:hypothetical protein
MLNINTIFFFLFIFSVLVLLRTVFKYIGALLQKEPKQVLISGRELIYLGLSISYIITYIRFN